MYLVPRSRPAKVAFHASRSPNPPASLPQGHLDILGAASPAVLGAATVGKQPAVGDRYSVRLGTDT
ncbi:MAG: hypothetical protein Q7J85_08415, partial [Bacillota bacterium]|nr:hypothetical protein [Bacillota bacterium]